MSFKTEKVRPITIFNHKPIFEDYNKQLHFAKEYNSRLRNKYSVKVNYNYIHPKPHPNTYQSKHIQYLKQNLQNIKYKGQQFKNKTNPITCEGYKMSSYCFQNGPERSKLKISKSQRRCFNYYDNPFQKEEQQLFQKKKNFKQKNAQSKQQQVKIKKHKDIINSEYKQDRGKRFYMARSLSPSIYEIMDHNI